MCYPFILNSLRGISRMLESTEESETLKWNNVSKILPSLYLCGKDGPVPTVVENLGITCVINATQYQPHPKLSVSLYHQVPILDNDGINISEHFDEVADIIERNRQNNGKTMVHCMAGISRSTSLVLAYLMKHRNMSLRTAFKFVKSARPEIQPNMGFVRQLIAYEEKLFQKTTVKMVFKESVEREVPNIFEEQYESVARFHKMIGL